MIVWLNGPFGVGKTTAAAELVRVWPTAHVFNPERLGWVLRRTVGRLQPGDFQHLASWRRGTIRGAHRRARAGVALVVPMSVLYTAYLDEILTGLRSRCHAVHHVLLDASANALHARIAADTVERSAAAWRKAHIATYETIRPDLGARGAVIDTSSAAPRDVAIAIIERVVGPDGMSRQGRNSFPVRRD